MGGGVNHGKRIIVAIDDAHARAWVLSALERVDATTETVPVAEASRRCAAGDVDLTLVDGGRHPGTVIAHLEAVLTGGAETRLLLLIEPDALERLRLPVGLPADFIVRGASVAELVTRVRTLLWPGEELATDDVVRMDDLTLNLATYQAQVRGEPVEFTYLEYALFAFLVTHPNRVYGRDVLLKRVWGTDYFGGARTVDVHVRRIRAKLGPEVAARLETVRNVGYLWRR